jgi:cytochrome c oxidase assembly factor CtaG
VIALVLIFSTSPLYPLYAHLRHRPGGISALVDQELAGGMMLLPGSLAMTLFVFIQIYRWLGAEEGGERPLPKGARLQTTPASNGGPNGSHAATDRTTRLEVEA